MTHALRLGLAASTLLVEACSGGRQQASDCRVIVRPDASTDGAFPDSGWAQSCTQFCPLEKSDVCMLLSDGQVWCSSWCENLELPPR